VLWGQVSAHKTAFSSEDSSPKSGISSKRISHWFTPVSDAVCGLWQLASEVFLQYKLDALVAHNHYAVRF
jgi:hypothetical protein